MDFSWIVMHILLLEGVLHVNCNHLMLYMHFVIYVYCHLGSDES